MPRFSEYFALGRTQHQLDFVDVSNEFDTPVYVDPYAIEIRTDVWSNNASDYIRVFFEEVLATIRDGDTVRAVGLMSHLVEPRETFLGVSSETPSGRGVGRRQAAQLIAAIRNSRAFTSGVLQDLSEMALYVEGIDRDKISDLTTNIIRRLLTDYTRQQCSLFGVPVKEYCGPPFWDPERKNWSSQIVSLPYIEENPILLVPKYIVRRRLSLDSQEFYNRQITDFLIAENLRAGSSLVQTIKGKRIVRKGDVRAAQPKSKSLIADMVKNHPELLDLYKSIARNQRALIIFDSDGPTLTSICAMLSKEYGKIPTGSNHATAYHNLVLGSLTALFYPDLIQPRKEWEIHQGRKRIDIVFTNAADTGFFSQRRDDNKVNANMVIVECKNYSDDLANEEVDQLLGRFDDNRGKLGIITCRSIENKDRFNNRLRDASSRSRGYIICLTDDDLTEMLRAKSQLEDNIPEQILHAKYRDLLS